jgi:hypothetical protein
MFAKYMEKPHAELPVKKVPFRWPYLNPFEKGQNSVNHTVYKMFST